MKYLAIASLAAFAAASPALDARDGWEAYKPATTKWVDPAPTWANVPPPKKNGPEWDEWNKKPVYTTTVVTAITTYCPAPTTLYHAGKTWVVTKATTLTITDCPCTISVPVYVKTTTSCADKPAATTWANVPVKGADTWVNVPGKGASTWVDVPVKGASTWADVPAASTWADVPVKGASTSTGWNPVATWKGAADRVNVGAGLAGVVGVAALLL